MSLALLGACTGDPAPVTTPSGGSTTASAVPTPEPTRPVEAATPESAVAFTRYFWDLYNYAYQTYDTAPLKAISDPACKFCSSAIAGAEDAAAKKLRTMGGDISVLELASPPIKIVSATSVICSLRQGEGKTIDRAGNETVIPAVVRIRSTLGLEWVKTGWRVHGVDYKVES